MREPRYFIPFRTYEVTSRTRRHMPFAPTVTTNMILTGIIARILRFLKLDLCHFVLMGNHDHSIVVPHSGIDLSNFYKQSKKRRTDAVKAMMRIPQLNMWEDRSNVMRIPFIHDVSDRIAYIYANPAAADLVDTIADYPGLNSWQAFLECEPRVDAEVVYKVRYYHQAALPPIPEGGVLSAEDDDKCVAHLMKQTAFKEEYLRIRPFAFLKKFGITNPATIAKFRDVVVEKVMVLEAGHRARREAEGRTVLGAEALQRMPFMSEMIPKKHGRKVSLYVSDPKVRKQLLRQQKRIRTDLELLQDAIKKGKKKGNEVQWPHGFFRPGVAPTWGEHERAPEDLTPEELQE